MRSILAPLAIVIAAISSSLLVSTGPAAAAASAVVDGPAVGAHSPLVQCHRHKVFTGGNVPSELSPHVLQNASASGSGSLVNYTITYASGHVEHGTLHPGQSTMVTGKVGLVTAHEQAETLSSSVTFCGMPPRS